MNQIWKHPELGTFTLVTQCDPSLTIRESLYEHKKPIAELTFSAGFEPEHGVGILTDGNTILGTSYASDVLPYGLQHHE
jgi:hypothetical protein